MAGCSVILDTCSYFMLAQFIHPLLKNKMGSHVLGVIKDLDEEYSKNPILKHKFYWVAEEEYVENRKDCFSVSKKLLSKIHEIYNFIDDFDAAEGIGLSRIDIKVLAHSKALEIPVVTDDGDMLGVAEEFEIRTIKTLHLLKILLDDGFLDMSGVKSIVSYWIYNRDTPSSYRVDYRRLFGEPPLD